MDPGKIQVMVAVTILLMGIGFFSGVILEFTDPAITQWFQATGRNILVSIIFLFALVTAIMLIVDTRKG